MDLHYKVTFDECKKHTPIPLYIHNKRRRIGRRNGEVISCSPKEREALLAFKRGLTDDNGDLSSWRGDDCCNWDGVGCRKTTGHVISLYIYGGNRGLRGQISVALLQLRHLRYLTLSGCGLFGRISQNLSNLTNLVYLDLSFNSLLLDDLNWLSNLSSLSHLDLSDNNITDANWPQRILKVSSLKELLLAYCHLSDGTYSEEYLFVNSSSSSASLSSANLGGNDLTLRTLGWLSNIRSLVYLKLSANQLDGVVPHSIRNLTFLEHLDLSHNKLKRVAPGSLENLSNLTLLDLSYNELGQPLMELTGNLSCKALEELDLRFNKLSGLPPDFVQHRQLVELHISYNSLDGILSKTTFTKLDNLKWLDLSSNDALSISPFWNPPLNLNNLYLSSVNVGPKFPPWIQVLEDLWRLGLSSCGISDQVPNWFWNFSTALTDLTIPDNQISGTIPDLFSGQLRSIDLRWNRFYGPLPEFLNHTRSLKLSHNEFSGSISSICKLSSLVTVDLSDNLFVGMAPNCWENMTNNIQSLNLGNNSFSGEIPESLGLLEIVSKLYLNDNDFSGKLPSSLKHCNNLELLDVAGNNLTGTISEWLDGANYTYLKYLKFRQNKFYSDIPQEICNLTQIQVLDLSKNNLSGKVPKCLNNFVSLLHTNSVYGPSPIYTSFMYLDSPHMLVQWKRKESLYEGILWLLKLIDFSDNKLTGSIPRELFQLKGLVSLNLSRNALEGNIATDIGDMEMLESLDLSRNHLSGAIPTSLAQLSFLQILNLSNNNLSGRIPTSTQLQSFNESSYAENAQLCGSPLPLCPGDAVSPPASNPGESDEERRNGFMSFSVMQDLFISMALGFVFGFWGLMVSLMMKRSWRISYFMFFDRIGDWAYVKTAIFLASFRRN
ncbi:receptor-like protein EIX1 [Andrographis paniculata]|uniref:receptor-like protein EIX1 n=1 Tax=Andrographis paniculata TaxID=175694 RepID=UPI0021E7D1F4|nr:receptor-like protein EIX1 [Andrographis paniculata]